MYGQEGALPHLRLCGVIEEFEHTLALLSLYPPFVHHIPHLHLHCVVGDCGWGGGEGGGGGDTK